jgi:hypothetical protein
MDIQIIITAIAAFGVGGLLTAIVSNYLDKGREIDFKKHEQKERRYCSVLLFMDAHFEPQNIKFFSGRSNLPPISSQSDVLEHLKAEYHEMLLYSPKSVLLAVKKFIEEPNRDNFLSAILKMRQDLWIKEKDLNIDEIRMNLSKSARDPHA